MVVKLRLKISLSKKDFKIPISYNSILQGIIYNTFDTGELGKFYHDEGFRSKEKVYKLFVFSNLFGKFKVSDKLLTFEENFYFYISALDERFIAHIYDFFCNNEYLFIGKEKVRISEIKIIDTPILESKEIWVQTLSPVTVYRKVENCTIYYKPSDNEFFELIEKNIRRKIAAYHYPISEYLFEILEFKNVKERMVRFKDCYYLSYSFQAKIKVSQAIFVLLYNTGVSAKNSCGFGMIDRYYEKNNLSL